MNFFCLLQISVGLDWKTITSKATTHNAQSTMFSIKLIVYPIKQLIAALKYPGCHAVNGHLGQWPMPLGQPCPWQNTSFHPVTGSVCRYPGCGFGLLVQSTSRKPEISKFANQFSWANKYGSVTQLKLGSAKLTALPLGNYINDGNDLICSQLIRCRSLAPQSHAREANS